MFKNGVIIKKWHYNNIPEIEEVKHLKIINLISFLLRKTAYSLFVILGIITIVFILFNVIPADPAKMMLGERDDARQLEKIRKKYNLDKPLLSRYFLYLNDLSVISIYNKNDDKINNIEILSLNFKKKQIVIKKPFLGESFFIKKRKC